MVRYVGGIEWEPESKRLPQVVVKISREESWALRQLDRLERMQAAAAAGTRIQLVDKGDKNDPSKEPCVVVTGKKDDAVQATHEVVLRMLSKDKAIAISLHPDDVKMLRNLRCELLAEIENQSGCRLWMEDQPKQTHADLHRTNRQHSVYLLGDQGAQGRAVELLGQHCSHPVLPQTDQFKVIDDKRSVQMVSFHPMLRGKGVDVGEECVVAQRREDCDDRMKPTHCVVAGHGLIKWHRPGAFFVLGVRKVLSDKAFRGATRLALTLVPLATPMPDTLLGLPHSWVLGRGMVRGPDMCAHALPVANFDGLAAGEELGVLVTPEGSIAVVRRAKNLDPWTCMVHWEANIPGAKACYMAIEVAGRLVELEMLRGRVPPDQVGRAADFPIKEVIRPPADTGLTDCDDLEDLEPTLFGEKMVED